MFLMGGRSGNSDWPRKIDILGCWVSRVDLPGALRELERLLGTGDRHQVVFLTVNSFIAARKDSVLCSIYNSASLALPDGLPVVWASRLLGESIPGRVAGPDFLVAASETAARRGYTFFLLGGQRGTAKNLSRRLRIKHPGLKVVGTYSPPFYEEFPPALNARIVKRINAAKPDVLWVGLGSPKQDRWIAKNLKQLAVRVAVGVGAAFDMCGGTVPRAPVWMQKAGLEWFYRFLKEPRRLFRRYFIEAPLFIPLIIQETFRRCCFSSRVGLSSEETVGGAKQPLRNRSRGRMIRLGLKKRSKQYS